MLSKGTTQPSIHYRCGVEYGITPTSSGRVEVAVSQIREKSRPVTPLLLVRDIALLAKNTRQIRESALKGPDEILKLSHIVDS